MKYIVITGASKGIGNALAHELLKREKCGVALTYNTHKNEAFAIAQKLTEQGFFVIVVKMDISNEAEVKEGFDYIYKCFPRIDVLINNAGIALVLPFYETTTLDWNRIINVNLNGAFYTIKQVIDKMNSLSSGVILNITSVWGEVGASCEVAYSASKAGLIGMTKALSKEYDLSIKAISVGFVDTDMNRHMTKQDIDNFLLENSDIAFRSPMYTASKILEIMDSEIQKVESGYYLNNDKKDDVVIRIW